MGSSSENWLHNATIQRLQAKEKQEEDRNLFLSPISHCSSQLTPDILKYHRGRTYGLSDLLEMFQTYILFIRKEEHKIDFLTSFQKC